MQANPARPQLVAELEQRAPFDGDLSPRARGDANTKIGPSPSRNCGSRRPGNGAMGLDSVTSNTTGRYDPLPVLELARSGQRGVHQRMSIGRHRRGGPRKARPAGSGRGHPRTRPPSVVAANWSRRPADERFTRLSQHAGARRGPGRWTGPRPPFLLTDPHVTREVASADIAVMSERP